MLNIQQLLLASSFLSHVPWAFTKISVLLFFKRIFVTRRFSIAANILIGVVVVWLVAFITVGYPRARLGPSENTFWFSSTIVDHRQAGLCSYRPLSAFWAGCTARPDGTILPVINLEWWMLSDAVSDLILEVAIILLPIPMIAPLNQKTSRKLAILAVFGLGAL